MIELKLPGHYKDTLLLEIFHKISRNHGTYRSIQNGLKMNLGNNINKIRVKIHRPLYLYLIRTLIFPFGLIVIITLILY